MNPGLPASALDDAAVKVLALDTPTLTARNLRFHDALAQNGSARDVLGDTQLRVIAQELQLKVKDNVSIDWAVKDSARARLRVLVKNVLRKYGYPPTWLKSPPSW